MIIHIGNKNYSSWSMRGWLAVKKTGLAFEENIIPLRQPTSKAQILAVSPGEQVPALQLAGGTVSDSLAIAEWAAEQAPHLWPADPIRRAQARAATALMHSGFKDLRNVCPMNMKFEGCKTPVDDGALADAARIDKLWSGWLAASGGPFLFGDWSLADAFYAPVVSRFVTFSLPRSSVSQAYIEATVADPDYAEWRKDGLAETWTIPDVDAVCEG